MPAKGFTCHCRGFDAGLRVVAVEQSASLVQLLQQQKEKTVYSTDDNFRIVEADFLECNGNLGQFDAVLMNPPFEKGSDIKHIKHALTFLKPGGVLVAICANGPRQQEQLKPLADTWEDLPAGTFKESGTSVNTAMLTIKPRAVAADPEPETTTEEEPEQPTPSQSAEPTKIQGSLF